MSTFGGIESHVITPSFKKLDLPQLIDFFQDKAATALSAPELLRAATFALRSVKPTLMLGRLATVTRFADVLEVLENESYFSVGPVYAAAMEQTTGAFILGMDDRVPYEREAKFLRAAVQPRDAERIRNIVTTRARQVLDSAASEGTLDVASGFAHRIALAVVAEYCGVTGPDEPTMTRWMRTIFWDLFLNLTRRTSVTQAARKSAALLNAHLEERADDIRRRVARGESVPDDFFVRLVTSQRVFGIDDVGVRRNIGGIIVGAVDTVSKAIVQAFDQLLSRRRVLEQARAAARQPDRAAVAAYAFEALRFNPHNPIIVRHCTKDFHLARGTDRQTLIPAGTTVFASTLSAMFDSSVLCAPHEFRVDRPWEHYVHFGRGMHRCFGEMFNRVIIPEAIQALLLQPNLRRIWGPAGQIQSEGPFPVRWTVRL